MAGSISRKEFTMRHNGKFRFRKLDTIGAADAEDDNKFLQDCFVDTGITNVLRNCDDPRRIILGRTGSGKTAQLFHLKETEERVITLQPESLALSYISNSTILAFLSKLDVHLDIFFRLLWRHVFTVELLKFHFHIETEEDKRNFFSKWMDLFRDKKHQKALEYLEKWGKSFWEETEYRIKEVTTTLEQDVEASVKVAVPSISFSAEGLSRLTEEQKREVVERAQRVVNLVQVRELSDIIDTIKDVLADRQKKYFLIIDRLDEDWIDEALRYRLIRALIETVRDFRKVQNAKIVIALRLDLLERVFRLTRDAGFQEEKYQSLCVAIEWRESDLVSILDRRIDCLIRHAYTKGKVTHADVLPKEINGEPAVKYLLDRTLMRPRDIILFFNECIRQAEGKATITPQMIRAAEANYSKERLHSLADEWQADYPNLLMFADMLKGKKAQFPISSITNEEIDDVCLTALEKGVNRECGLYACAKDYFNGTPATDWMKRVIAIFFHVGLVGLKLEAYNAVCWASTSQRSISVDDLKDSVSVRVHPTFWRTLGISPEG